MAPPAKRRLFVRPLEVLAGDAIDALKKKLVAR